MQWKTSKRVCLQGSKECILRFMRWYHWFPGGNWNMGWWVVSESTSWCSVFQSDSRWVYWHCNKLSLFCRWIDNESPIEHFVGILLLKIWCWINLFYTDRMAQEEHVMSKHSRNGLWWCINICRKTFWSSSTLKKHTSHPTFVHYHSHYIILLKRQ